jgi:thiol:disulfide interchange protein DsbA
MGYKMKYLLIALLSTMALLSCESDDNNTSKQVTGTKEQIQQAEPEAHNHSHSDTNSDTQMLSGGENKTYQLGPDYKQLANLYDTENKQQVVVYEFFSYACRHCYTFEPFINKWLETKPDYVKLVRVPLNFNASWGVFQKAFLTAQSMGLVEKSHSQLFDAIHKKNIRFNTINELANWYAKETGVNEQEFLSTANSFIIDSNQRQADKMGAYMKITSTPTLIVNGKYIASNNSHERDGIIEILDFLVEKEAQSMGLISN